MKGKTVLAVSFCLLAFSSLTYCQEPPSDLQDWILTNKSIIELPRNGYSMYLGFFLEYRNKTDSLRSMRIIKRCLPRIFVREELASDYSFETEVTINYGKKEKNSELEKLFNESDPIAYVVFHVEYDSWTKDYNLKTIESWQLDHDGKWVYGNGDTVGQKVFSEPNSSGKSELVGFKFTLGDKYHILKINRDILISRKPKP